MTMIDNFSMGGGVIRSLDHTNGVHKMVPCWQKWVQNKKLEEGWDF
jgi:hypothetical protein